MGSDLSVVNAARVSYAKTSTELTEKDKKLILYLAKHGHWTPFAHTSVTLRIKAPIFVARQLVKHQVGLVWNEVSRRYVDDEPAFFTPRTFRERPSNSKQGSGGELGRQDGLHETLRYANKVALDAYHLLLSAGVAPEQARMVLPLNSMTEWWWTGSIMAFARVCKQRLDAHAQEETADVARGIDLTIKEHFPVSWEVLMRDFHAEELEDALSTIIKVHIADGKRTVDIPPQVQNDQGS
jgi:thymidylate synthase (FAD)